MPAPCSPILNTGYPYSIDVLGRGVGLLLALEDTGYEQLELAGGGRKTHLIDGWSVTKAARAGANAIKLLLYYRPDAPEPVIHYQREICLKAGRQCREHDLPLLLELVAYPLDEQGTDSPEYAKIKPKLVAESAAEFSKPEYAVDVLKLEFPASLKHTLEFADGAFDGKQRQAVYALAEVEQCCRQVHQASRLPWVILSAGVNIKEFLESVRLACAAGASGFLCGRAIWADVLDRFPDYAAMTQWLDNQGAENFKQCNRTAEAATPWFEHPRFSGMEGVTLAGKSQSWCTDYPAR